MAEVPDNTQTSTSSSSGHQSSSMDSTGDQPQWPKIGGLKSSNGSIPIIPIMFPGMVPGLFPQQEQEQMNRGPGLYAVPVHSYMQPFTGFPPNTLIPFTYNVPTAHSSPETRELDGGQGHVGEQPQQQQQQQAGPQRQFRRFQIAIRLDLFLILKLAAVIFLFNQDGSRQRLTLLVFFASIVYLYQTGALAPVIQWLSQGMQRAAQPPREAVRADNLPAAEAQGNENGAVAEGQQEGEYENQQVNEGNRAIENEAAAGDPAQGEVVNRWRVIVKEIQLIVFGFITSLLPGFNNID